MHFETLTSRSSRNVQLFDIKDRVVWFQGLLGLLRKVLRDGIVPCDKDDLAKGRYKSRKTRNQNLNLS